jgi:PAS domain S-box-containing protein
MLSRKTIDHWPLKMRLPVLVCLAGLPLVITAALTANLWRPVLQPGVLVMAALSFLVSQALVIWVSWKIIGSGRSHPNPPEEDRNADSADNEQQSTRTSNLPFESDTLFQIFMEYLPALVIAKDREGRYVYANSSSMVVFGKDPEELIGKTDSDLWPEDTAVHLEDIDRLVLENQQVINTTSQIPLMDQTRHLIVIKFPIQHRKEGLLLGGIIFDVTAKVKAEESKAQLEQQLIQSQKMEAIGTLAGGIAHDFNNILAAIFGYVELIRMDLKDNPNTEHQLNQVMQASLRAKELVHQILAFSRKQEQERRPVDLTPLIKETIKLLRASLPSSIEIKHQLNAKGALIMADATQIHQVIMNLSTNAAHAMESNGGVLTVHLSKATIASPEEAGKQGVSPGTYLELCIEDTGHGIAPAQIERIFEPYFTTKPQGKGTGMGLAVVHGIITSHGGTIVAESQLGKGSTFRMLMPLTNQKDEPIQVTHQELPKGNESILFVDDEEYLADVVHRMLTRLGYQVNCCTDPEEALATFSENPEAFDLLITDMTMPHMNGDILARKALEIRPNLPIILCTGYSEQITAEKAAELGIASFLMKPITISDLSCTLRGVLEQQNIQQSAMPHTSPYQALAN